MKKKYSFYNTLKTFILLLVLALIFYFISRLFMNLEFIFGIVILSFGVLAVIWTLLAKYSLSPGSRLRIFTNNFLACSIAVLSFFIMRLMGYFVSLPWFIYVEFFFIFATFFFFVLASYYIYMLGKEFGFQRQSEDIKNLLKKKKNLTLKRFG